MDLSNKTNSYLINIIEDVFSSDNMKDAAWEQLMKQNPTNSELQYIIEYTSMKDAAAKELRKMFGAAEEIDEEEMIKKIANEVLSRPGSLHQSDWHCGTSHCIAGHCTLVSEDARKIEEQSNTETAGYAMLPNYANFFYVGNDEALTMLQSKADPAVLEASKV